MYYYGGGTCGCNNQNYSYPYAMPYYPTYGFYNNNNSAIFIVLFILLVIILGSRLGGR